MDNPYPNATSSPADLRLLGFPGATDLAMVRFTVDQVASALASPRLLVELSAAGDAFLQVTEEFGDNDALLVLFEDLVPSVDAAKLRLRLSVNTGGSWLSSNYKDGSGSTDGVYLLLPDLSKFPVGDDAGDGVSGSFLLQNVRSAAYKKVSGYAAGMTDGNAYKAGVFAGAYRGGTAEVTGLQVAFDSGNITSGRVRVIGV